MKLPVEDDIALRRSATCSATPPSCIGTLCAAGNAFDGDILTRWVGVVDPTKKNDQDDDLAASIWLEIDLGFEQPISEMRFDFSDASSDVYEVSVKSQDTQQWRVLDFSGTTDKLRHNAGVLVQGHRIDQFTIATTYTRYVRFRHVSGPEDDARRQVSLWEWSIFSGNIVVSDVLQNQASLPDGGDVSRTGTRVAA